jgi:bacterioferritin-associated ferredoxin
MYVCICNAITDKQIRQAARSGVSSLWELQKELGVASNCGKCRETAVDILREHARPESSTERTRQRASSV